MFIAEVSRTYIANRIAHAGTVLYVNAIIFTPSYGVLSFTVPQFDEFSRRRAFSPLVVTKRKR